MAVPAGKSHLGLIVLSVAIALVIGGLLRAQVVHLPNHPSAVQQKVAFHMASNVSPLSLANFKNGFAAVIDPALPAVVNISSTTVVKRQNTAPDFFNDPLFRQFFGDQFGQEGPQQQGPQTERQYSLGSGVIVDPDGYIMTNNHVVSGASDVEVFTQAQRKYKARVIGTDPETDVAVLKIDASGLPVLTLGDASKLNVGDLVFAIGDPFGIGETATTGIVSATGRGLEGAIEHYEDFIQTDAAINPGNSGGALIDLHGDLIGINTAIISGGGGGNQGVGFAIPINMARNVMEQIVEHGKVTRGYLGVSIQPVDSDMAKAFGLSQGGGALVASVSPDSPAAKAGMERGDVILSVDGQTINNSADLSVRVSQMSPGAVAHLQIFRMGQKRNVDVTLGEFPENAQAGASGQGGEAVGAALKGLQVQNLTPELARQLGLPASDMGLVVTNMDPSSAAASAGLQAGDIISEINHKAVHNVREYQQMAATVGNQPVLLLVSRQGVTNFVVLQAQ